jgi:hypothetical protein
LEFGSFEWVVLPFLPARKTHATRKFQFLIFPFSHDAPMMSHVQIVENITTAMPILTHKSRNWSELVEVRYLTLFPPKNIKDNSPSDALSPYESHKIVFISH